MFLAQRVEAGRIARDLFAALGIEGIGLQRPGDFVQVFGGLQDGARCQCRHAPVWLAEGGCGLASSSSRMAFEVRFQIGQLVLQLIEQRGRLAQRRLQAADRIFQQRAVEPARAAAMLGEEPAPARTLEQRRLDGAVLVVGFLRR